MTRSRVAGGRLQRVTHSPIVMRRSVRRAHGAARTETTSHHRLPRFAARTANNVADNMKINAVTSDASPFPPANVATAPAAGITKTNDTTDARPHLLTRDVGSAFIPARSRGEMLTAGPAFLATSGASANHQASSARPVFAGRIAPPRIPVPPFPRQLQRQPLQHEMVKRF